MRAFVFAGLAVALATAIPAQGATPPCTDVSRTCLVTIANAYLDGLVSHSHAKVPLAPDVVRFENGKLNAVSEQEVRDSWVRSTHMITNVRDRRFFMTDRPGEIIGFYLIDVDLKSDSAPAMKAGDKTYESAVTVKAGKYTLYEAERFRIENGLIKEVEIILHPAPGVGAPHKW